MNLTLGFLTAAPEHADYLPLDLFLSSRDVDDDESALAPLGRLRNSTNLARRVLIGIEFIKKAG